MSKEDSRTTRTDSGTGYFDEKHVTVITDSDGTRTRAAGGTAEESQAAAKAKADKK